MQNSLLQIDKIAFHRVQTNALFGTECPDEAKCDCAVEVFHHEQDANRWMVVLTIEYRSRTADDGGYSANVIAVGEYRLEEGLKPQSVENLVEVNGPAVLYSSAREMILLTTSRGPLPPLLLPSKTFIDRKKREKQDAGEKVLGADSEKIQKMN